MEVKICPSCGEKNNPTFLICWKCKSALNAGESLIESFRGMIKEITALMVKNQYIEADSKLSKLESELEKQELGTESVQKLRISCNLGLMAEMQGVSGKYLQEAHSAKKVEAIDQALEFHLTWHHFARAQAALLKMDLAKLKDATELSDDELNSADNDPLKPSLSNLRKVMHDKARKLFPDEHECYVATCVSDALFGMMLLNNMKKNFPSSGQSKL